MGLLYLLPLCNKDQQNAHFLHYGFNLIIHSVFDMFRTSKCSSSGKFVYAVLWYFFHAEIYKSNIAAKYINQIYQSNISIPQQPNGKICGRVMPSICCFRWFNRSEERRVGKECQ
jgi:hypothetical protein